MVVREVTQQPGKRFTMADHTRAWKHFNTRPSGGDPKPEVCDNRYCFYDALHKDYIYTSAWVEFLTQKLADQACGAWNLCGEDLASV